MFLFKSVVAQRDLVQETLTTPGHGGLKLSFSHFDGYSPMLEGSVRVAVVKSSNSEKSGDVTVAVNIKASSPSYRDNVRVHQKDNEISISTGGLSLLSYASAPRLMIDVAISLPHSIGDVEINTLSLPIFVQTLEKGGDVVLRSESSPITVAMVEARSLTVTSQSGKITFEEQSEQVVDKDVKVSNSSGSISLRSSIFAPSVLVEDKSGSIGLAVTTSAKELTIKNTSGTVNGGVEYSKGVTSNSTYQNTSGSLNLKLKEWTGFVIAASRSGSKNVRGDGLEKFNDGWKKGDGDSKVTFKTQSGSINVEVL